MAVSSIFVELDIDLSKFKARQQTILNDIKKVGADSELALQHSFTKLGVTADQTYQLMANLAIKSYEKIAASANASAAEQVRAQSAMVAKINALNQEMTKNPLYETLGIRSVAAIEAQKQAVIRSFDTIRQNVQKGSQDWINIERAKNDKLKELNKEMMGVHESSIAGMMRGVLRLYAAYYVLSSAAQYLVVPFKKGFEAVEEYNKSVASLAAMVVTFSERAGGQTLADQWKGALQYSTAMVPVLEQIAAKTLLSGQETTALANAFARSGVFLNANSSAQIEAFTRISNALPLMTQGQEIMRQINTEIRSVMTGANEQSSMMLQTLKAIDPQINEHLRIWRAEGTVMEHIGEMLVGFGPATQLLENQWQAVKTTIDTTATQILRGVMKPAYEEIINLTKELNKYLLQNKDSFISQGEVIKKNIEVLKQWMPMLKTGWDALVTRPFFAPEKPSWMATFTSEHQSELNAAPAPPKGNPLGPTKEELAAIESATKRLVELTRRANLDIAQFGKDRAIKEWEEMESTAKKMKDLGVDSITIAKYVAAEKVLFAQKLADEELKSQIKLADEEIALSAATTAAVNKNVADRTDMMEAGRLRDIGYLAEAADYERQLRDEEAQALVDAEKRRIEIIGEQVDYYKDLMGFESKYYAAKLAQIEEVRQAEIRAGKDIAAANAKAAAAKMEAANVRYIEPVKQALNEWAYALENISQLYEQGSSAQKKYHDMSVAFALAQKGFDTANAVVKGVEAVINAMANGDGYTAIARGLAVAAVVASYLAQIGASFSGAGGSTSTAANTPTYTGVSTVLGASDQTGSESIQKSWELLQDTYDMEDTKLTGIYNEMKDLNQNITGLVTGIVRGYGTFTGIETTTQVNQFAPLLSTIAEKAGSYSLFEKIFGNLGTRLFNAIDSMLWGGSKTSSTASGLSISGGKVQSFTDILTEKSWSIFGGAGSDERSTIYGAIDEDLTNLFSGPDGIYTNLTKTFEELAKGFGTDTQSALNYIFADAKINLQGLDAEGVQKAVSEFISKAGDDAVRSLFGTLISQYQQIGEGLLETAIRLVVDKESVLSALEMTNKAFTGTAMEAISLSESLIKIANGLDNLTEAANTYYDKFFTDAEKQADLFEMLAKNLGAVPGSRVDYRRAVEALNLSNEADRERYVLMLQLADSADKYYSALEDVADAQDDITKSLKAQRDTIIQWLADMNLSPLAPSNSMQAVQAEYSRLKGIAGGAGATSSDTSNFLNYAKEYLSYMRSYGGDYKQIYGGVMSDVTGMKTGIDAQIDLAQKQLDALNLIVLNTGVTATAGLPGALPGQSLVNSQYGQTGLDDSVIALLKGAANGSSPSPYWTMDKANSILDQFGIPHKAGLDYVPFDNYPARLHKGERVLTANEARGYSSDTNGERPIVIENHLFIDSNEIGNVVTKQISRNGNLSSEIRRVAN